MDFQQRISSESFLTMWREAHRQMRTVFATSDYLPVQKSQRYANNSLWTMIQKPFPGIELIAIEMTARGRPDRIRYRIWVNKMADALYRELCAVPPPVLHGRQTTRLLDQNPDSSYRAELRERGVEVRGLFYDIREINFLETDEAASAALGRIGMEFANWVYSCVAVRADGRVNEELIVEVPVLEPGFVESADIVNRDPKFADLGPNTRIAITNARIGQGRYRLRMEKLWNSCCAVTGLNLKDVLTASHAVPWADCSTADCLNPYNGLLLTASLDRLFDRGMIAFADDGAILKQDDVSWDQLRQLGVTRASSLRMVHPKHVPYLTAHRARYGYRE